MSLRWAAPFKGEPLHVMRGVASGPLDSLVTVWDGSVLRDPASAISAGVIASMDFKPRVRISGPVTSTYTAAGLEVTVATGNIQAAAPPPGQRHCAFYLDITVELPGGDTGPTLSALVWLHDTVVRAWLTPSRLTLPRDVPGPDGAPIEPRSWRRPTLLAEFDDGCIGDLTNHPGVEWLPSGPAIEHHPLLGYCARAVAQLGDVVSLQTVPPIGVPTAVGVGKGEVAPGWEERPAAERTVECLTGVGVAADADAAAANVLILADGIPDTADQAALAGGLARRCARIPPYSWVGPAIRFWWVPVSSREDGGTQLREANARGGGVLHEMPTPRPPGGSPWSVESMLHELGPAGTPPPPTGWPSLADQIARWELEQPFTAAELTAAVTQEAYDKWQDECGFSVALNHHDTAFSTVQPQDRGGDLRLAAFHPDRFSRGELDRLLGSLRDGRGTGIGERWVTGPDRRLVVILCGGHGRVGVFSNDHVVRMSVTLEGQDDLMVDRPGTGVDSISWAWPRGRPMTVATPDLVSLFAHELGHALGLGDEYGGKPRLEVPSRADAWANTQAEEGPSGLEAGGTLDGERIRWNHHRVARAFLLEPRGTIDPVPPESVDPPQEVGGRVAYVVRLRAGQLQRAIDDGFDPGDPAHRYLCLRTRPPAGAPLDDWDVSPVAEYLDHDASIDRVWVREAEPGQLQPFLALLATRRSTGMNDPILFATVPTLAEPDGHARLVPALIRAHVTATGRPLDAPSPAEAPTWVCTAAASTDWPAMRNRPAALRRGRPFFPSRRLPALWTGGHEFDCGVFHPTANSIMRSIVGVAPAVAPAPEDLAAPPGDERLPAVGAVNEFDPVSRYLLVDRLDPTRHHMVEAALARQDPS